MNDTIACSPDGTADGGFASVLALARDLVRIPSRGGIDDHGPVLDRMAGRLYARGLPLSRPAGVALW